MRFGRTTHSGAPLIIEMVPMIDVVFLLMVFFMTTVRFAQVSRAKVELPKERGEMQEHGAETGLVINMDREGRLVLEQQEVALDEIERAVASAIERLAGKDPAQLHLTIRADHRADTARLNALLRRLQPLGIGTAQIATEVPR